MSYGTLREAFALAFVNARLTSVLYLVLAAVAELGQRLRAGRWAEQLAIALEAVPARLLSLADLLAPLRRAWLEGQISPFVVRVVYLGTFVAFIHLIAIALSVAVWALWRVARRWRKGVSPAHKP